MEPTTQVIAPPETELSARLRLVVSRLARRLRQQAEADITPSGLSALSSIEALGPCTLGELAARERVQPPTMTRVIARLEEHELVERTADERDRRVARVALTPQGRHAIQRIRNRKNAYLAKKLRSLQPDEIAAIELAVASLERVLAEDAS